MDEKFQPISKKDVEGLLVRLKKELQDHEYIETNDFKKLGCDSVLIRFLSFHYMKLLNQFPKQLENYNSEIIYYNVSPSEKVAFILLKLQDAAIQVSTKEFISFIQNLFQFHNFKSELLTLDDIPKVSSSEFRKDAEIGRGGFGVIYRGIWEGIDVAIKQLHLGNLSNDLLQEFINEAQIMHKCQYPNIVRLFAICVEPGRNSLIMEYLPKGSLFQNLSESRVNMPWFPLRWNISLDIAKGLNYLHSRNIIHQDMKSMNILLDKDWKAKISDFGLSTIKSTTTSSMSTINSKNNKIGSVRWSPPELFNRGSKRSKETDVYSFGMTLWEISSRKIPFYEEPDDQIVISFIIRGEKETIPNDCPLPFSQIITKCWNSNPKERPSMSDVIVSLENSIDLLYNSKGEVVSLKIPGEEEYERAISLINSGYRKESIPLLQKSASLDYPPSFLWFYFLSVDVNEKGNWKLKAASNFNWYQSKAQDGKSDSLFNLGFCFCYGIGTKTDLDKAIELYEKAVKQGFAAAQNNLGYCYYYGKGVPQYTKKAVKLYIKAAIQGFAEAQYSLGFCYNCGEGVPRDTNKAIELYTKAAEQGHAGAQFSLGFCYENGNGVSKDLKKAIELYTKAAEQGHASAQYNLGTFYASGKEAPKDLKKAVEWYTKAAEQGDSSAQFSLGFCYKYGEGVPKDINRAVEILTKAAEQGHAAAQCSLGYSYENGDGVPKDMKKAMELYYKAAKQGDVNATMRLKDIRK